MSPSRRSFLTTLSTPLLAWLSGCAHVPGPRPSTGPLPSNKKGVGVVGDTNISTLSDELRCSWYYNWWHEPTPGPTPSGLQWVPMIWSGAQATTQNLRAIQQLKDIPAVLAFNEPDRADQADMAFDQALLHWPALMQLGLPLGSPAPSAGIRGPFWLDRFMAQAKGHGYRVDFICLHYYGDINGSDAIPKFERWLHSMHRRYGRRPIWITEFGAAEIDGRTVTPERAATFASQSVALLDSLPFVERYAWFASHITKSSKHAPAFLKSSLLNSPSTLSQLGQAYARG